MNNWIEVSEERLGSNLHAIQAAAGAATVLAVIKANAYGHGAAFCAVILVRAGARWLGVTCASEGARVRLALVRAGLDASILVMSGFLHEDAPLIHEHQLTPVVWTEEQVEWLASYPGTKIHVEVDTGMGRQGVSPGLAFETLIASVKRSGLSVDGIFTHFCSSEVTGAAITAQQQERFRRVLEQAQDAGLEPTWVHAANTSAVDNPVPGRDWLETLASGLGARLLVRTGLSLYGYCLPLGQNEQPRLRPTLLPVMTWKAHVLAVRDLAPGETVGYNVTFKAERPMRIALLPVGYADGLRRELSSREERTRGWVMLDGRRAAILGRVSMNLTVVDVTSIPGVRAGDEAVVLGDDVTADDHARLAGTIAYEILCGVHPCN